MVTPGFAFQLFLLGAFGVFITVVSTGRWHGGAPAWREEDEDDE